MRISASLALIAAVLAHTPASRAQPLPSAAGPLIVESAWVRMPPPGASSAALYFSLRNVSPRPVIVVALQVPGASRATIHDSVVEQGVARMRPREKLVIAPGATLALQPGGTHVMLEGYRGKFTVGQSVPLVLVLADGATVQTAVVVRPTSGD